MFKSPPKWRACVCKRKGTEIQCPMYFTDGRFWPFLFRLFSGF